MSDISSRCATGDHDACWTVLWIPALEHMPPCACACHEPCAPVACPPVLDIETHQTPGHAVNHITLTGVDIDDDGYYHATCGCGLEVTGVPALETIVDILMEHAYEAGRAEAAS